VKRLHIISYLSPSIPAVFFHLIAADLDATIEFNVAISGPLPSDEEPFTSGRADVGFVCSPTYRWLRPGVELLTLHRRHSLAPFGFERFVMPDASLYA
jgi:hypothetical protein